MIDRLGDRDAFQRLRREGKRHRSGPLSIVVRTDPLRPRPAVAFAVPRRVGNAVTRNRVRRRLRELVRDLDRRGELAPGDYLVLVSPGAATSDFAGLRFHVEQLSRKLRER